MRKALIVVALLGAVFIPGIARVGARQAHAPSRRLVHVVHQGETLWEIAGLVAPRQDVVGTVDRLVHDNRLGSKPVRPGQPLFLNGR